MFKDFFTQLKTLDEDTQYDINHIGSFIQPLEKERVEQLTKQKQVKLKDERFPLDTCLPEYYYPLLSTKDKEPELLAFIESVNNRMREGAWQQQLTAFSKQATTWLEQSAMPEVQGIERIKSCLIAELAAKRIHTLLVGDPVITKLLLEKIAMLSPTSSLGPANKLQQENLLSQANQGVCCVYDMQELKAGDRTLLYTAMEHGYVKMDKGVQHQRLAADTCVIAAATAKGIVKQSSDVKKLTGLDSAFLGRFHLIFLLPKESYTIIKTKPLSKDDTAFIKRYIELCGKRSPSVPIELAEKVRGASKHAELLFALAKAAARLELRDEVLRRDIDKVKQQVHD